MPSLLPFPKSYTAEMVCSNGDRTILYVDGLNKRREEFPNRRYSRLATCATPP